MISSNFLISFIASSSFLITYFAHLSFEFSFRDETILYHSPFLNLTIPGRCPERIKYVYWRKYCMIKHNKIGIQYTLKQLQKLVKKVCYQKQISQYHFKFGPKIYTQHQFVALLILYAKSGKSLRNFTKHLYESKWPEWLKLKGIPSKSSIHSHFQRIGLTIIRNLNLVITKLKESIHYAIDSTGIDSDYASKHYEKRINRIHRPYLKLSVIGQTQEPFLIKNFNIIQSHYSDFNHAKPLLKRFKRKDKLIFADKAYDGEEMHQLAKDSGNMLYCPLREKCRKPKGVLRRKMLKIFDEDIYHERNKIETIMFLLKHKGLVIRSRKRINKERISMENTNL